VADACRRAAPPPPEPTVDTAALRRAREDSIAQEEARRRAAAEEARRRAVQDSIDRANAAAEAARRESEMLRSTLTTAINFDFDKSDLRDDAKAALLRYEVAAEKQVPADALDLLVGSTREELEAKADRLLSFVKTPEAAPPEFDGGPREPAPEPKTPEQAHNELAAALFGSTQNT